MPEIQNELLTRAAAFQPNSFNAERGTVEAIISGGADVPRRDYQGAFIERLTMNPQAWSTAGATVPVLKDHQRKLDSLIGVAENVRVDSGQALATIRLSDREDLAGFRRDIQTGIVDSLSVGYTVPKWREFRENGALVREAEQVVVHEVSFVTLGSDPGAKIRSHQGDSMTQQEQFRSIAGAVGVPVEFADELVTRAVSEEDGRSAIIREAARLLPTIDTRHAATVTRDAGDGLVERLADGLLSRINPAHKPELGREFAYFRVPDIAKQVLQSRGLSTLGSPAELITRAMHTTSDFSNVLAEVFNKSLLTLRADPSPILQIFKRAAIADFRARHIMEISDGPGLLKVNESGEIKFGTITDKELASYKIESYARGFSISFKALVNDDMGALSDLSAKMTRGARQWFTGFLAGVIISNPALADTKGVFHVDHNNLAAAGAAPSNATIQTAKLAMRLQTDASGNIIDAPPKFLVIPAALENAVDQLLATLYPETSANVEVAARGLTPLVIPQFDAAAANKAWYLFADPSIAPVFEYAELSGYEGPRVETRQGFETLGTELRVVWHVGAGAIDSRGGFKNPGL